MRAVATQAVEKEWQQPKPIEERERSAALISERDLTAGVPKVNSALLGNRRAEAEQLTCQPRGLPCGETGNSEVATHQISVGRQT